MTTDLVTRHGIRGKRIRGTVSSGLDDRQLQLVAEHEIPLMTSQSDYPVLIKAFEVDDLNCILEDVDRMVKYAAFPDCYGKLAKQAGKVSIIIGAGEWQLPPMDWKKRGTMVMSRSQIGKRDLLLSGVVSSWELDKPSEWVDLPEPPCEYQSNSPETDDIDPDYMVSQDSFIFISA